MSSQSSTTETEPQPPPPPPPPAPPASVWVDFVAGWAAGAVSVLAVQPVDTFLTRWQANRSHYLGGWLRGASPMIATVPLQNALLMGGYGVGQQWLLDDATTSGGSSSCSTGGENTANANEKLGAIFVGGCTGGILQSFLMSPVELVKVTQQLAPTTTNVAATTTTTAQQHHPLSLLQSLPARNIWSCGLTATLLRDGVPHGVWFVAYDMCKTALQQQQQQDPSSSHTSSLRQHHPYTIPMVSGAVAATVAWGVGYPFDLIKTRMQAEPQAAAEQSVVATARQIVAERGLPGLYRGFGLKLVRSIPASMISFSVYEAVKDAMV